MSTGKITPGVPPQGGKTIKVAIGVREDMDGRWLVIGSRRIRVGWEPWFIAIRDFVLDLKDFMVRHNGVSIAYMLEDYGWVMWTLRIIDSKYPIPKDVMREINEEIERIARAGEYQR
ncbi:hypothetical protein [Vulcanisaeta sp. JCM 14467]|uniref:hypothetical protein n=1 Tax=Vulcanisaeta sp. JCM 14467 TaxID=1295370 RepID=UPI0006CF2F68|nr:hypothetical protein [Vulcanisaeta sp. JCM 14467]